MKLFFKNVLAAIFLLFISFQSFSADLIVSALKTNGKVDAVGIEIQKPLLSWQIHSQQRNIKQIAYHILVSSSLNSLNNNVGDVWDSGKVNTQKSINVVCEAKTLVASNVYYWKVKIWDNKNQSSSWSSIAKWQMGLIQESDWLSAKWIGFNDIPKEQIQVPFIHLLGPKNITWNDTLPLFRKEFYLKKKVKQATLFISGLGQFEAFANGEKIGDHFLDPAWTKYETEANYVSFDVSDKIEKGKNALGVMLGNGFYYIPRLRYRKISGAYGHPKMICRLKIIFNDGTEENIISNDSWKTSPGPVSFSSIYGGEDYDANLLPIGWKNVGFKEIDWRKALIVKGPLSLAHQLSDPLKIYNKFKPITIKSLSSRIKVYDMAQNLSGIPAIEVQGNKGDTIRIFPSELLNKDGTSNQSASGAPTYFQYILSGEGIEKWQPQFTYYGFRYLQVEAKPNSKSINQLPNVKNIYSLHTRSSVPVIGDFSCSDSLFNQTYDLINWAIKSNITSVFTDCPHREKLGWLEQSHLMASSMMYNYDIQHLGEKVVRDMILAQTPEGLVPDIAPEYVQFDGGFRDSPEWGSAIILLPWYLYQQYGNERILKDSYLAMKKYASYLEGKSSKQILNYGLGDWFDIGKKKPGVSQLTPKGVTATAIYYYDLKVLEQIAQLLNETQDQKKYANSALQVKRAYNKEFYNLETGNYASGSQTANAISLFTNLVGVEQQEKVIANLIKDITDKNYSLTAGDIGYRYLLRVLEKAGRSDVIFKMNNRYDVPGYGYQITKGATSLTESWQAFTNVSNNHLMLGHLMEWFYSGLVGIKQAENGVAFEKIIIEPQFIAEIQHAKASFNSPFGIIKSEWKKNNDEISLDINIPANCEASVILPTTKVILNGQILQNLDNQISIGSGYHQFKIKQN